MAGMKRTHAEANDGDTAASTSKDTITPTAAKKLKLQEKYKDFTDEEMLDARYASFQAKCYEHFQKPIIIVKDGKKMFEFVCRTKPSKVVHRGIWEDSTKNLNDHVNHCAPPTDATGTIVDALGSTYSAAKY
ncbi:hypothetical protein C8J56DRAFT_835159, partial [Mycena floridula]